MRGRRVGWVEGFGALRGGLIDVVSDTSNFTTLFIGIDHHVGEQL